MEEELGKQLFIRSNRRITLTEEGMLLRKRAEEITELVKKTQDEISLSDGTVAGDLYIGAAETVAFRFLVEAAQSLQGEHPLVHFHVSSGDRISVTEDLDKGLIDFALVFGEVDLSKYHALELRHKDVWGVLMRRDAPLAEKEAICAKDLWDQPIILSRQEFQGSAVQKFLRKNRDELNIVATCNLLYNGSLMTEAGMGYLISLEHIINTTGESELCFRPLTPRLEAGLHIIWKKYQVFSKAAQKFLSAMQSMAENGGEPPGRPFF